jgi:hypothetical protein
VLLTATARYLGRLAKLLGRVPATSSSGPVCTENLSPEVLVMKSAQDGK